MHAFFYRFDTLRTDIGDRRDQLHIRRTPMAMMRTRGQTRKAADEEAWLEET